MMKKSLLTFFTALLLIPAAFAGEFSDKGWISGWKFAPLQVDAGLIKSRKLVDESSDTFFSFGVFTLQQHSAIFSLAFVANTLQNNYGLQINPLLLGTATDNNYGVSFGFENYCKRCYGIQLGILNRSWGGEKVEKSREILQFCGANIADTVYVGVVNVTRKFQIGIFNAGVAAFQIGLLNFNPRSYIPWMPLINFDMGKK